MSQPNAPKDGDFASYLEHLSQQPKTRVPDAPTSSPQDVTASTPQASVPQEAQTIEDVLLDGQEPSDELLEKLRDLENAPPLSDDELARQALEHPGADEDPRTPE